MIGGMSHVTQDVLPFVMMDGESSLVVGLNRIGLRRAGMSAEEITQLKQGYRTIYRSGLTWEDMLSTLRSRFASGPAAELAPFLAESSRGFVRERRVPPGATVRLVRGEDDHEHEPHRRAG